MEPMMPRLTRAELERAPIYDPDPQGFRFRLKDLPADHRFSDFLIGLVRVALSVNLLSRTDLEGFPYVFTSSGAVKHYARANGHPFLDMEGRVVNCDMSSLSGKPEKPLYQSPYCTETILLNEKFRQRFKTYGFQLPKDRESINDDELSLEETRHVEPDLDQIADIVLGEFKETIAHAINMAERLDKLFSTTDFTTELITLLEREAQRLRAKISMPSRGQGSNYDMVPHTPTRDLDDTYDDQQPPRKRRSGDHITRFDGREDPRVDEV